MELQVLLGVCAFDGVVQLFFGSVDSQRVSITSAVKDTPFHGSVVNEQCSQDLFM